MIATMEIAAVYLFMWGIWSRNHVRWGTSEIVILPQEMFAIHGKVIIETPFPRTPDWVRHASSVRRERPQPEPSRIWRGSSLRVWTCWWMWWGKSDTMHENEFIMRCWPHTGFGINDKTRSWYLMCSTYGDHPHRGFQKGQASVP